MTTTNVQNEMNAAATNKRKPRRQGARLASRKMAEAFSSKSMTQSITSLGVLMDQSQSNALWGAAGAAWKKSFDLSAERLERDRDGGRASGGAIVKVMITKDTPLW